MNSLRTLTIIGLLAFVADGKAAVLLTNFGNGTAVPSATFTIDGSTSFSTTQHTSDLQISGNDLNSNLDGTFGPVNITGQTGILILTGSSSSAPASPFSVTLYDSTIARTASYTGGSWTGLSGSGTTSLTFASMDPGFDFSSISGLHLGVGGAGATINATLTSISASASGVPEPSRALLAMMGFLSLAIRRRRA